MEKNQEISDHPKEHDRKCEIAMPMSTSIPEKNGTNKLPVNLILITKHHEEGTEVIADLEPANLKSIEESKRKKKKKGKKHGLFACFRTTDDSQNDFSEENYGILRLHLELDQDNDTSITHIKPSRPIKPITAVDEIKDNQINEREENILPKQSPLEEKVESVPMVIPPQIKVPEKLEVKNETLQETKNDEKNVISKITAQVHEESQKHYLDKNRRLCIELCGDQVMYWEDSTNRNTKDRIWIDSYYQNEMADVDKKFDQYQKEAKNSDSLISRKIDMQSSYIYDDDDVEKKANIKWHVHRQLEIALVNNDSETSGDH